MRSSTLLPVLSVLAAALAVPLAQSSGEHAHAAPKQQTPQVAPNRAMDLNLMDRTLRGIDRKAVRKAGTWQLTLQGSTLHVVTDQSHDRMRILAPIVSTQALTEAQHRLLLEANFHTALDARYASSNGTLFAAFIHPLSSLTVKDLRSAALQVASLAQTFGSSYSSGKLQFGTPHGPAKTKPSKPITL